MVAAATTGGLEMGVQTDKTDEVNDLENALDMNNIARPETNWFSFHAKRTHRDLAPRNWKPDWESGATSEQAPGIGEQAGDSDLAHPAGPEGPSAPDCWHSRA